MSYYLKYRPQRVEELDLAVARNTLLSVLESGKYAHAYLMTGPKGTGKTSSARILAKILNCETNKELVESDKSAKLNEPCLKCSQCKTIAGGSSVSVIEMDAASNRGIDDVRLLKERVALAPAEGARVVYVIDEVHMLTNEAFNAFLKTLEEPPKHAVFVLCTTEPHKLPDTIISRCNRVSFKKATADEVVRSLTKAVKGEGLDVEDEVLLSIAGRVDGSFRDGMKILEQMAQSGKKITAEMVDDYTGYSDEYDVEKLIDLMLQKDAKGALTELDSKYSSGVDISLLAKRLVESLRQKLLEEVMANNIASIKLGVWKKMSELFSRAAMGLKLAVVPEVILEIAVVEWCLMEKRDPSIVEKKPIFRTTQDDSSNLRRFSDESTREKEPVRTSMVDKNERNQVGRDEGKQEKVKDGKGDKQKSSSKPKKKLKGTVSFEVVKTKWGEILSAVRPHNHSIEALLKSTQPKEVDGERLVLEVFYTFHKEQLEQERHRKIIEEVIAQVLGAEMQLHLVLGKKTVAAAKNDKVGVKNITGTVEDEELVKAAEEIFS